MILVLSVTTHDDKVDEYFDKIKSSLIKMIADNPENGEYTPDLPIIAKYFERIGDHSTNIAEWVIFSVTGEHKSSFIELCIHTTFLISSAHL